MTATIRDRTGPRDQDDSRAESKRIGQRDLAVTFDRHFVRELEIFERDRQLAILIRSANAGNTSDERSRSLAFDVRLLKRLSNEVANHAGGMIASPRRHRRARTGYIRERRARCVSENYACLRPAAVYSNYEISHPDVLRDRRA